jgi:predicted DsbA family dithiol-disulfide isomerase
VLVEIWSDVVCPWCVIGKARFERALEDFEHADAVDVRWRSFELDPNRSGTIDGDYVTMLAKKYRTNEREAQAMIDRMTDAGAEEGIDFRFDVARPGNTFDAHRVLHLAAQQDRQHEVKQRFLTGYHSEGAAIADHDTLVDLAHDAGLDRDDVREVLDGDAFAEAVRRDEAQAYEYGISGVPFFVLDQRAAVAGAQPAQHLLAALRQVHEDGEVAAGHDHAPGEACEGGACAVA